MTDLIYLNEINYANCFCCSALWQLKGEVKNSHKLIGAEFGVASRCDGCIGFHTQALSKLGASRQEVIETLGMAVYMGGGPSLMYAAEAISAFEEATT
jgi:hypothetical protein